MTQLDHHPAWGETGNDHDRENPEVDVLSPLTIRGVTLPNRIGMAPMCQYSAVDGVANDWHLVHLGARAVGGAGLILAEATAVTADGRISPADLGLWADKQVEPLARIVRFLQSQGAVAGVQLAHAGRKASSALPWDGGAALTIREDGGWPVIGPSPVPFHDGDPSPLELNQAGIDGVIDAFEAAAHRAVGAGFQILEIHAAHGYLLHEFLSPLTNHRSDRYGGALENRMRLTVQVAERVRTAMPADLPLFVRISATDWVDGGWDLDQSVQLARRLRDLGVDLIDVSTGGIVPRAHIPVCKGYQVPFARRIREQAGIRTAAVGLITEPDYANDVVTAGDADVVLMGRELLREPYWPLKTHHDLGADAPWPIQYHDVARRRGR